MIAVALVGLAGQASAQLAAGVGNDSPSVDPRRGVIAPTAQLELTPEQKAAIFDAVRPADGRVKAPGNVAVAVGAQVPPATELYFLPDNALATAPEAKAVKYTVAQNRVVLVDPTTMRVVDVIPVVKRRSNFPSREGTTIVRIRCAAPASRFLSRGGNFFQLCESYSGGRALRGEEE